MFFDFKIFIYRIKQFIMRRKIEKKKMTFSISLDVDVLKIINETIANRSKYIQNCIIEEMCKSLEIKEELTNKKIIL